jgi:hypothetical protein
LYTFLTTVAGDKIDWSPYVIQTRSFILSHSMMECLHSWQGGTRPIGRRAKLELALSNVLLGREGRSKRSFCASLTEGSNQSKIRKVTKAV